jgi:hypothetical protein
MGGSRSKKEQRWSPLLRPSAPWWRDQPPSPQSGPMVSMPARFPLHRTSVSLEERPQRRARLLGCSGEERGGECGWAIPWQPLGCLRCSVVRAAMHCPQQGELQREAHDARGVILGLPACCPDHWGRRPPRPITGVLLSPRPPRCIPPLPSQEEAGAPSHALS